MSFDVNQISWEHFPLFENVSPDIVKCFIASGFHFQYPSGTLIVSHQDQGETFFLVTQGIAKLILKDGDGIPKSMTLFRTGDFFGELSMLEPNMQRNGDVEALDDVHVLAIQKKAFLKAMLDFPILSLNLARVLGKRLRAMNQRLLSINNQSSHEKVVQTLSLLADSGKTVGNTLMLPPLSLKEWALFSQTTTTEFLEAIEGLKASDCLEWQNQRIVIKNRSGLRT